MQQMFVGNNFSCQLVNAWLWMFGWLL